VGILLQNALNCVIDGNLIQSNVQDGILLTGTCPSNAQNVIKHNQIIGPNPLSFPSYALTGVWAIEDDTAPAGGASTNNYFDNAAFNYPGDGVVPGQTNYNSGMRSAGNAIANPNNGFVVQWLVPGDPPVTLPGISNLDVMDGACGL
jgi:parallel beta-helix repeat protein